MSTSSNATIGAESLRALAELARSGHEELDRTRRELAEINVLIKQTTSEIERVSSRTTDATNKLREAETAVDNYTRAEIRDIYAAAKEAEMRLFLMKGQLEQLEYKRDSLQRYEARLQHFVGVTQGILDATDKSILLAAADSLPVRAVDRPLRSRPVDQDMGKIIDAQEDERQRMARQIHDGPAQDLANLILRAEICERLLANDPEAAKSELAGLKTMVTNTLHETRQFIFDLRPMILDDLGLVPTLRRYIESLTTRTSASINLSASGTEGRFPSHMEIGLFRIAQEALDNAITHAKANEIHVTVEADNGFIRLTVEDDGTGFDVEKVSSGPKATGLYGIAGILERARSLGGKISIDSKQGQGTRVSAEVPF